MHEKLLGEIAYQYYVTRLSQDEISKRYNIGRSTISRMIKQAVESNIVEFKINDIDEDLINLKNHILKMYPINYIEISKSSPSSSIHDKNSTLGLEATQLINRLVNNNQNIGISWGQALAETVSHLKKRSLNKVTIIPLVGGPSNTNNQHHINSLVHEFAHKTNGDSLFINASAVSKNKQTFDKTISSQQFRQIQSYWTKLDIAFVGIGGTLSKTNSLWRDLLTDQDIDFLKQSDVIGDCCCRFIDKHGKIVSSNLNKRTIAIPFPTFLNIPERIGIARGKSKISAIRTVLDNEYLTGLVTDAETASALIK